MQLNMYSFKKMSKRKNSVSFKHEEFRRDNSTHFENIKRRKQNGKNRSKTSLEKENSVSIEEPIHSSATISTLHLDC